jgi:hypothetical protein
VRKRLDRDLPAYEALPEHDKAVLGEARELARLNLELAQNVDEMRGR